MLRIDYKCISRLTLIWLAACAAATRRRLGCCWYVHVYMCCMYALLFVTVFIYLAATPQAAGIWLMIIGACAESLSLSLSHPESFSHIVCHPTNLLYSLSARTRKSDTSWII